MGLYLLHHTMLIKQYRSQTRPFLGLNLPPTAKAPCPWQPCIHAVNRNRVINCAVEPFWENLHFHNNTNSPSSSCWYTEKSPKRIPTFCYFPSLLQSKEDSFQLPEGILRKGKIKKEDLTTDPMISEMLVLWKRPLCWSRGRRTVVIRGKAQHDRDHKRHSQSSATWAFTLWPAGRIGNVQFRECWYWEDWESDSLPFALISCYPDPSTQIWK